jgi:DNA-binding CsgD family transcriptional regulator
MTPAQVKKIVEDYSNYSFKREKLQKRLINLSGRDLEQEIVILQRLESVEREIELIDSSVYEEEILTLRESSVVELRKDGRTYREIAEVFSLSIEWVRKTLRNSYIKIAEAATIRNVA